MTSEDRIEQAKFFKQKGTDYFKMDNFKLALKFYKKMIDYLKDDISSIYLLLIYQNPNELYVYFYILDNESQIKEIQFLTVVSYINSALCNLKSNRHTQAKNDCDNALRIDPINVKAMFRKGEVCIRAMDHF